MRRPRPPLHARSRALGPALLALALLLLAGGCGDPPAPPAPPAEPPLAPPTVAGHYLGQEVWIPFQVARGGEQAQMVVRDEAQARARCENLRERVRAGEDIGRFAFLFSAAPTGVADGYVVLPADPARPDARDLALMRVREGELTPVVAWQQGFWFARRIDRRRAAALQPVLEEARASEVRGQAIVIHHREAWPYRHDEKLTPVEASGRAQRLLARLQAGEDFAALARQASSDASGDDGGVLLTANPVSGRRDHPWIRLGSPDFPPALVNALLRGPVGEVWPEVLDTSHGFVIAKPLERRRRDPADVVR